MFLLQPLQPLGLIHAQPTVFFLPVVVRVVGEPELPTGVEYRQSFASFQLDRPQMLKDLFGRIPFLGHDHDLPGCGPVSHSPWTEFARAGQLSDAVARAAQHAPLSACAPPGLGGDLVDRHGDLPDPGGGPADLAGDPVNPWRDHGHPAGHLSGRRECHSGPVGL